MFGQVFKVGDGRVVVLQHRSRELLDLGKANRRPTHVVPGDRGGFDSRADGQVVHSLLRLPLPAMLIGLVMQAVG